MFADLKEVRTSAYKTTCTKVHKTFFKYDERTMHFDFKHNRNLFLLIFHKPSIAYFHIFLKKVHILSAFTEFKSYLQDYLHLCLHIKCSAFKKRTEGPRRAVPGRGRY